MGGLEAWIEGEGKGEHKALVGIRKMKLAGDTGSDSGVRRGGSIFHCFSYTMKSSVRHRFLRARSLIRRRAQYCHRPSVSVCLSDCVCVCVCHEMMPTS